MEFSENEKVLCFHKGLLYEARCLKVEHRVNENGQSEKYYKVHYNKWSKNWDEWVPGDRIRKYTDENISQKEKMEEHLRSKQVKQQDRGKPSGTKKKDEDEQPQKRVRSDLDSQSPSGNPSDSSKLNLPQQLKHQLIDDHEFILKCRLVSLPRKPSVSEILKAFAQAHLTSASLTTRNEWVETMKGLFCVALGPRLLYAFEREQYREILQKFESDKLADVYGAEHLLRLLSKLSDFFAEVQTKFPQIEYALLLLDYLDQNFKALFMAEYDNATPAYIRTALHL